MNYKTSGHLIFVVLVGLLASQIRAGDIQAIPKSIAVLEFEAKGVSKIEASTLTDRFRSELVRTDVFLQIERNKIEQIFKEQKLQISGMVSDDQLVEIGQLLGAELLVIGSIGKLGSTYTIDLRLVEVETGEIIASYFKDHRGEVDGLLDLFRVIAGEIAGKEYAPRVILPPVSIGISTKAGTPLLNSLAEAQMQGKNDAAQDYSKFVWGVGGAAGGAGGSCLFPLLGGAVGAGAVAGAGYVMDASPPMSRLETLAHEDAAVRHAYIKSYEDELKKNRAKWGGGGGVLGCCVTTILIAMALSSTVP